MSRAASARATSFTAAINRAIAADADSWAEVGVIVDPDHGHDWRVQLHVVSGAGRLRPWARG